MVVQRKDEKILWNLNYRGMKTKLLEVIQSQRIERSNSIFGFLTNFAKSAFRRLIQHIPCTWEMFKGLQKLWNANSFALVWQLLVKDSAAETWSNSSNCKKKILGAMSGLPSGSCYPSSFISVLLIRLIIVYHYVCIGGRRYIGVYRHWYVLANIWAILTIWSPCFMHYVITNPVFLLQYYGLRTLEDSMNALQEHVHFTNTGVNKMCGLGIQDIIMSNLFSLWWG